MYVDIHVLRDFVMEFQKMDEIYCLWKIEEICCNWITKCITNCFAERTVFVEQIIFNLVEQICKLNYKKKKKKIRDLQFSKSLIMNVFNLILSDNKNYVVERFEFSFCYIWTNFRTQNLQILIDRLLADFRASGTAVLPRCQWIN